MKLRLTYLPILFLLLCWSAGSALSQTFMQDDTIGAHCSLFYLKSDKKEIIPFNDICFVTSSYSLKGYRRITYVGPLEDKENDLFFTLPWALTFELPEISENGVLKVALPAELDSKVNNVPAGKVFAHITDNRRVKKSGKRADRVDYRAMTGSVKILDYTTEPEYGSLQFQGDFNLYFQQILNGKAAGELIKVSGTIMVVVD